MIIVIMYLSLGFGFALASWLQAVEVEINEGVTPSRFVFSRPFMFFFLLWWLVAIYCYRSCITKTIPKWRGK